MSQANFKVVTSLDGCPKLCRVEQLPAPSTEAEALKQSIQKWEFIANWHKEYPLARKLDDGRGSTCGLCIYNRNDDNCDSCVVGREKMEYRDCEGTPYMEYGFGENLVEEAGAEVTFLKSLRPKVKKEESK